MARQKKEVDWLALEIDYRANMKTMRMMAQEYGISTARICQVAEERSWERDLAGKIAAKAQSKLDRSILDAKLDASMSSVKKATEKQVVEANATLRTDIQLSHRKDIGRSRELAISLLGELEHETKNLDLYEQLGEMLRQDDDKGHDKRNDLYNKVISSAGRVDSMKKLAETLRVLVGLEREAYGITSSQGEGSNVPAGLSHFYGE